MILAIDIGNTNIVAGVIQDGQVLFSERISTDLSRTSLEYAISFKNAIEFHGLSPEDVDGCIVASVVPPLISLMEEAIPKITNVKPMIVRPGIKTGLKILMDNPAQVGADLIVAAVAGIAQYPCPQILIDMGTATTITVIDKDKNYTGGMILPGLRVSLDSLTSRTSQLPRIGLDAPKHLIGKNTVDCMKSGVLYGTASSMDGMIERIQAELGEKVTTIATGGLAGSIVPLCRHKIILDNDLILKGLVLIYERNQDQLARSRQ